jgi:hypothetical protein
MKIEPLLRALADPTRLRIMRLLAHMELAVGELAQVLGQSQPRVSRHIRILCDAGLAERRKEGSWVSCAARSERTMPRRSVPPPPGCWPRPSATMRASPAAAPRIAAISPRSAPRAR